MNIDIHSQEIQVPSFAANGIPQGWELVENPTEDMQKNVTVALFNAHVTWKGTLGYVDSPDWSGFSVKGQDEQGIFARDQDGIVIRRATA